MGRVPAGMNLKKHSPARADLADTLLRRLHGTPLLLDLLLLVLNSHDCCVWHSLRLFNTAQVVESALWALATRRVLNHTSVCGTVSLRLTLPRMRRCGDPCGRRLLDTRGLGLRLLIHSPSLVPATKTKCGQPNKVNRV